MTLVVSSILKFAYSGFICQITGSWRCPHTMYSCRIGRRAYTADALVADSEPSAKGVQCMIIHLMQRFSVVYHFLRGARFHRPRSAIVLRTLSVRTTHLCLPPSPLPSPLPFALFLLPTLPSFYVGLIHQERLCQSDQIRIRSSCSVNCPIRHPCSPFSSEHQLQ